MSTEQQQQLPVLQMEFPTLNDCTTFIQAYAKQKGFATGTTSSNNNLGKLLLTCVHYGRYRQIVSMTIAFVAIIDDDETNDDDEKNDDDETSDDDILDLTKKISVVKKIVVNWQ
ncbi:hypothetical protein [Absidia glauca]|uniref:Uncharacterized protein n=1 Tax=Absidia glauca TaxID=4829 RepID=A0A163IYG2_ABSGL|nr:hypothetical protein [Absidia glauca]